MRLVGSTVPAKGKGLRSACIGQTFALLIILIGDFEFTENSAESLTEAANFLRHNDPSYGEHVIAQVILLQRYPDEFDGKAILLSMRDERLVRIWVEFEEPD